VTDEARLNNTAICGLTEFMTEDNTIDAKEAMINGTIANKIYTDTYINKPTDTEGNSADDHRPVEHAGMLEDDDGNEYIVLMDQSGYTEVRAADDPRFGEDWRDY
jgi:hypothetical protein